MRKGMGTAVITCCDTPPVLLVCWNVFFNKMPTFIQRFVERKGCISGFPRRYADCHPLAFRDSRNQAASYPPSARKMPSSGRRCWRMARSLVIADLSFGQQKQNRPPMSVADRMEFGIQSALCPAY